MSTQTTILCRYATDVADLIADLPSSHRAVQVFPINSADRAYNAGLGNHYAVLIEPAPRWFRRRKAWVPTRR